MTSSAGSTDDFDQVPAPQGPDTGTLACDDVRPRLPDYGRGALDSATAWQVEWHVAHCLDCERSLSAEVPLPEVLRIDPQLVASIPLADTERHAMREAARRAVRASAASRRRRRGLLVAAAAMLAIALWRGAGGRMVPGSSQPIATAPDAIRGQAPQAAPLRTEPTNAPMATAMQLATADAAAEFRALREAAHELEEALGTARDKASLYVFRDALEERRRELEQRVSRVTE